MSKELIEELRATFDYHPNGYLIRKKNGKPCGQRANDAGGYACVKVGRKMLKAHRVIYAIVTGQMPDGQIDHIDQNRMNNRIENLRDVSQSENAHNSKIRKTNTSSFTGVYWYTQLQKWESNICVDSRLVHLGYFDDFDEAVQARKMAKIKYHPTSPEAAQYSRGCGTNT